MIFIKILSKHFQGHGGDCGNFAVALRRLCKQGNYIALFDSIYEGDGLNHVVLEIDGVYFDSSGIISEKQIMEEYAYDEDYYDVEFWLQEVSEDCVLSKTEEGDEDLVNDVIEKIKLD